MGHDVRGASSTVPAHWLKKPHDITQTGCGLCPAGTFAIHAASRAKQCIWQNYCLLYNGFMNDKCMGPPLRRRQIEQVVEAQRVLLKGLQAGVGYFWTEIDLTMSQMKALQVLTASGPLSVGELAQTLSVGSPAASVLVDALVRQGLLTRAEDPADRRRTLVALSPQGQELAERLLRGSVRRAADWLMRLSDKDLADLARVMQTLAAMVSLDLSSGDKAPS